MTAFATAAVVAVLLVASGRAAESAEDQAARLTQYSKLLDQIRYNPTPAPNNPELDCLMRDAAYDFSLKLLPQRSPLKAVWDAMVSPAQNRNRRQTWPRGVPSLDARARRITSGAADR